MIQKTCKSKKYDFHNKQFAIQTITFTTLVVVESSMCNGRGMAQSPLRFRGLLSLSKPAEPAEKIGNSSTSTSSSESSSRSPRACHTRQYPVGNHLWINTERMMASLDPLCRRRSLDEMARQHAEEMADAGMTFSRRNKRRCDNDDNDDEHAEEEEKEETTANPEIRENILVGPSIQTVHMLTMSFDGEAKNNILNPNFRKFGMGAVKGSKNNLYICQLFI